MSIPCPLCGRPLTPAPIYRCFYCNNPRAIAHYFDDHENNVAIDDAIRDGTQIGAGVAGKRSTDAMSMSIWNASKPLHEQDGEIKAYLASRSILGKVPPGLRYHPSLAPPATYQRQPTMVARYANSDAIHRTFLISRSRGTLGVMPDRPYIDLSILMTIPRYYAIIGEGIETTLSYNPSHTVVYRYATTTANVTAKSAPKLPEDVSHVVLLQDNDKAGKMFTESMYDHYTTLGFICNIVRPELAFNDFNDQLQAQVNG